MVQTAPETWFALGLDAKVCHTAILREPSLLPVGQESQLHRVIASPHLLGRSNRAIEHEIIAPRLAMAFRLTYFGQISHTSVMKGRYDGSVECYWEDRRKDAICHSGTERGQAIDNCLIDGRMML